MEGALTDVSIPAKDRLIYALDGMALQEAIGAVRQLREVVKIYKVGPSLIYQGGLEVANQIVNAGGGEEVKVFLDMKTWDIPETVLHAIDTINAFGAESVVFATIHTYSLNLQKLVEAKKDRKFKIFAVTLLTSQDQTDLADLQIQMSVEDYVLYMAKRAREFRCDGIICSGLEAKKIKEEIGRDFLTIVPGVRPAGFQLGTDDQKRVVTPREAILNGADYIVVGRPIRNSPDPLQAAQTIQDEIKLAISELEDPSTADGGPQMLAAG